MPVNKIMFALTFVGAWCVTIKDNSLVGYSVTGGLTFIYLIVAGIQFLKKKKKK